MGSVCGGVISKGRREEGKCTVHTHEVSADLEGATQVLSTAVHPGHLAFSHDAGPLPLSTSTYVWSPVFFFFFNSPSSLKGVYPGWPNSIYWCLPSLHFLVIEWETQIMCLIDQREQISFVGINNSLQLTEPEELHSFEAFDWSCPGQPPMWGTSRRALCGRHGLFCSIIASNLYLKLISLCATWPGAKGTETNLIYSMCFFSLPCDVN